MAKKCTFPVLALAALLWCGCSSIVNLTPSRYPRSENGFYRVEAKWKSNQQAERSDSFQPQVVIGLNKYPMRPVPVVEDQWEAYIPVPATNNAVVYHYQFDYQLNGFYHPKAESKDSPDYLLKIVGQP